MTEQVKGGRALWGGHFATDPAPLMAQINASIGFDKRLASHDLAGSRAHARMLAATGVIAGLLAQALLPAIEKLFRVTTALSLKELNDASHPLLRRLETQGLLQSVWKQCQIA